MKLPKASILNTRLHIALGGLFYVIRNMLRRLWSKYQLVYVLPILVFAVFLAFFAVKTHEGSAGDFVMSTRLSAKSLTKLSETLEEKLRANFYLKYNFIDMAGGVARGFGLNSFNEIDKLRNGYLSLTTGDPVDPMELVNSIAEFNSFLKARGIPFLLIAVPDKRAIYDSVPSPGHSYGLRDAYAKFVKTLRQDGVDVLDMDAHFKEERLRTEDLFYRSDHHWTVKAAQFAAKKTMEHLFELNLAQYDPELLNDRSYKIESLRDWHLGSPGKRTGLLWGGVDDIEVYYPLFPSHYSYAGLNEGGRWSYSDSILDTNLIKNKDLHRHHSYFIYMYGLKPLHRSTNRNARNTGKILVLGDSFRLPWQFFMHSQFQKMESLEMRTYTDGTVAQYVGETHPELVIMVINAGEFFRPQYKSFGVKSYGDALETTKIDANSVELGDLSLSATASQSNKFMALPVNLKPGITYTVSVKDVSMHSSHDQFVQMTLQDLIANKAVTNRYFSVGEGKQKWIVQVPSNAGSTYALYVYAGTKGQTKGSTVTLSGVSIREGVHESN